MLEMPGLVVGVIAPPVPSFVAADATMIDVRVSVTTMCGCPVEPKGLWDADKLEVTAIVSKDGKVVQRVPLRYAGTTSQFAAPVPVVEGPGTYDVTVYAYDPANGNTGLDRTTFTVLRR